MRIHELYGSTETGSYATLNTETHYRQGSCGRVRPDMELRIADAGDIELPAGEQGEILVRPRRPSVIYDGYYGRPEITVTRNRNLWFHSGDLGWLDEDGYLHFAGRIDDRIRRGGRTSIPAASSKSSRCTRVFARSRSLA